MDFGEMYGRRAEWQRRSHRRLVCAITAIMLASCCVRQAGAVSNPLSGPVNATRKLSKSGEKSVGQRLKKAEQDNATIIWVDEAGFYLLPMAVRTWAPRGQTPVLRVPLTREHLSSISGITPDGRLFLQVRPTSYDAAGVVGFLRVLLRKISGKLVVIWDGSPIHRGQEIKDFLKRGAAKRLQLHQLPGYAPDLNPDEGIWNYLKRVELANVCCRNLDQLQRELIRARERLRHKKEIIKSCSRQCGYSV